MLPPFALLLQCGVASSRIRAADKAPTQLCDAAQVLKTVKKKVN